MRILLIDIETAPNTAHVWGLWQQNVSIKQLMESSYTLCWAAKWLGNSKVIFNSVYKSSEEDMLGELWHLLNDADVVIHYNGSKFDIPTINKEFLLKGYTPPSPYKQIDLLKITRRTFKFPSNKLDYVCHALGLGEKVPHIGHELWVKCMGNDPASWRQMEKYNKGDVVLLEKLYNELLPWITTHPNYALYTNSDRPICTNCGSAHLQSRGTAFTGTQRYRRFQCVDCSTWVRTRFTEVDKEQRENILVQDKG